MGQYSKKRLNKRLSDPVFKKEWEDKEAVEEWNKIKNEIKLEMLLSNLKEENRHPEVDFDTKGKELI